MQDTDHPVDPFAKPTHQHYLLTENATPTKPTKAAHNGTYVHLNPRSRPYIMPVMGGFRWVGLVCL